MQTKYPTDIDLGPNEAAPDPVPVPTQTEIAFILDRSGSMAGIADDAIGGFNQFLRDQQKNTGGKDQARLTLVLFDDQYEVPVDDCPIHEVPPLDDTVYTPRGSTALLDAIGRTIQSFTDRLRALPASERPDNVIFAIYTDGYENCSNHYTWRQLAGKITRRTQKYGWQFLFLAAGQDAIATAGQMGIQAHNAATVSTGGKGVRSSSAAYSRKIRAMRDPEGNERDRAMPMEDIVSEEER